MKKKEEDLHPVTLVVHVPVDLMNRFLVSWLHLCTDKRDIEVGRDVCFYGQISSRTCSRSTCTLPLDFLLTTCNQ